MMKIAVVDNAFSYAKWLEGNIIDITSKLLEANLVIFPGGADVDPSIYGETKHFSTGSVLQKDLMWQKIYRICILNNIPMMGICKGSQYITAMQEGGKLVQDVRNHAIASMHTIFQDESEDFPEIMNITSTHHQMMYPFNIKNYQIIACSAANRSSGYYAMNKEDIKLDLPCEPEIVYYPDTNCLAIQGHPEYMDKKEDAVKFCKYLINKYLFKNL